MHVSTSFATHVRHVPTFALEQPPLLPLPRPIAHPSSDSLAIAVVLPPSHTSACACSHVHVDASIHPRARPSLFTRLLHEGCNCPSWVQLHVPGGGWERGPTSCTLFVDDVSEGTVHRRNRRALRLLCTRFATIRTHVEGAKEEKERRRRSWTWRRRKIRSRSSSTGSRSCRSKHCCCCSRPWRGCIS